MRDTPNIIRRSLWCFCLLGGGVLFLFSMMVLVWCLRDLLDRPPHVDWEAILMLPTCFVLGGRAIFHGWKALHPPKSISHHSH